MNRVHEEVNQLYKAHFGKMVASVVYSSRDINLEAAEDIVHDSYSAALQDWERNGVPLNPTGWLYKVCKNKALNKIRKDKRIEGLTESKVLDTVEIKFAESVLDDQTLKLMFACAHPDLTPKMQVVITLKYVINLKVEAISKILGMTIDGVDKLLLRARQKIKDEKILLEEPTPDLLKPRLNIVHKILYLIFNEGYKSSWGKEILREELCEDALLMVKSLIDNQLGNAETKALYALMLFNSARFKSRFGTNGELLELEKQDRTLWNKELILLATDFLLKSREETPSSYHLEASIAYIHSSAPSFTATDWRTISKLYNKLLRDNPNPFIELNFAIALFYAGEKERAFEILHQLHRHAILHQYYLLNATLGKLHHLEGNDRTARQFLQQAVGQTNFKAEKDLIQKMIADLKED
jgi:RNA polymerase sigma-70 factor (ECF subfamily)